MDLTINLKAKLQPMHRHDLEDDLQEILTKLGFDAEITGGGTLQEKNGEISSCDIELSVNDNSDDVVKKIIGIMESMLAPLGSQLIVYEDDEDAEPKRISFGVQEGLGLYFSNDLDEEVYKTCDINHVYEEIERLLGDFQTGHIASYWEGEQTAFYLYGRSFEEMHNLIKPLLSEYPLCQDCKVVQIA